MSMEWVRKYYGVPAKRGGRVRVSMDYEYEDDGRKGTITSATQYVFVRLDGKKRPDIFHPLDLEYLAEEAK